MYQNCQNVVTCMCLKVHTNLKFKKKIYVFQSILWISKLLTHLWILVIWITPRSYYANILFKALHTIEKIWLQRILHFQHINVHLHWSTFMKYWLRIMILVGISWEKCPVTVLEVCHKDVCFKLEFPRGNHQELSRKFCVLVGDLWYTVYMADIVDMVRFWQTGDFNC